MSAGIVTGGKFDVMYIAYHVDGFLSLVEFCLARHLYRFSKMRKRL
jgi:hypothetical protein